MALGKTSHCDFLLVDYRYPGRFIAMVQFFFRVFQSVRPKQALKNLSLFAPLIFSGSLFVSGKFVANLWCVIIFTIMTSSIYLINDILDLPQDRHHPFKKKRPIASGELAIPIALFLAISGIFLSLYLAFLHNFFFFLAVVAYFLLQLIYTMLLKNVIVLDVMAIATGFVLRVYAGAFAINVHMSAWFLLCVVSLALFLAVGKRRAELAIITEQSAAFNCRTLSLYTPPLLDAYLSMFANSAWLAYALFTFFAPPPPIHQQLPFLAGLPSTLSGINKWLMITIPVVIYGLMRYMNIVYQGSRAESPEIVLLKDKPLLITVALWGLLVVAILYGIRP